MNKIIYGGGFDPVHSGHINIAKIASETLNGDVIFVPSKFPVWKSSSAPVEKKLEMLRLAIKDYPKFFIDEFELNSGKDVNYSIDTVKYFIKKYPNDTIYYLIGADQANKFQDWKDCDELSKIAKIVYLGRPNNGINADNIKRFNFLKLTGKMVDISSTDIKNLLKIDLPEAVLKYIEDNDLYFIPKVKRYYDDKRYCHVLSVANLAYKIAKKNNIDNPGAAFIAGILHDCAKKIENKEELMEKYFPEYVNLPKFSYHQFLGAYLAEKEFGIHDQIILNAIKFHATGYDNMTIIDKIIYASDKIDPVRGYDSSEFISAMENDAEKGFLVVLKANKDYLESNNKSVDNPLTHKCFEKYL